jgi:hypothetical protein
MKLVNLEHNEDYVRFSKSLTIKVNDLITVEAECCGGLTTIDSKLFGKVIVLEDPDTCPTFYVGGKKTKYKGFKELYNQLFQDNYETFAASVDRFVENQILNTYDNSINKLTKKQKIKLLKEQIDLMPRFESDCGKTIIYRQWAVNEVLYTLNIQSPSSKKYNKLYEDGSSYGVELSVYQNILNELLNK